MVMGEHPEITLVHRLETAAGERPRLYHATRVLLRVRPSLPTDGSKPSRWWSGINPVEGWEEFLGTDLEIFEGREYERRSRWQQSCYYGDAERMNEYTTLAGDAFRVLPPPFAIPQDHSGMPHIDRDVWTLFMYRAAMSDRTAFALDTFGLPPYSDFVFPGLEHVLACTHDRDTDEPMVARFRKAYRKGMGRLPEFIYATMRVDVFAASILGIKYLIDHAEELYGDPGAVAALMIVKNAHGRNHDRDRWLYDRCMAGDPYKLILQSLGEQSKEWEQLASLQGIQQAANRFAERNGLPRPPKRNAPG
jgi:hypothetical protein